jgi:TolB-like protein/predicted Zn-dependent protease
VSAPQAVFLSYASQDAEAAKRIAEALRAAGVEVWFDQNELVGGDQWDSKIRGQISSCALFVPLISANTQARLEGYFRLEWKLAAQRTHTMADEVTFLLPVLIDGTRDAEAKVPAEFRAVQWTKLPGGEATPAFCARVRKVLSGEPAASGQQSAVSGQRTQNQEPRTRSRRLSRWWWIAPIFGMTMALALVLRENRKAPAAAQPTAPAATAQTEAQKLVQQAQAIYAKSDELDRETLFLADDLVKRALALDPAEPSAWTLAARLSHTMVWQGFDSSETRKADLQRQSARARALAPDSVPAQLTVVNAQLATAFANFQSATNRQDLASVERDLLALAARAPQDFQVQQALGQTYRFLKRPEEALQAMRRALELSGGDSSITADVINVLLRRKRYAEAEAMIAPALAHQPVGRILVLDVMFKTAWRGDLAAAQAAVSAWPGWLLREDRGAFIAWQAWMWSRRPDMALDVAARLPRDYLHDVWFTGPRAVLTARAHELAGHEEAAQADWRTVLRLVDRELAGSPDDVAALFWKAWAQSRLGDRAGAEATGTLLQQRNLTTATFFRATSPALLWTTMGRTDLAAEHLRASFVAVDDSYAVTRKMLELDPAYAPLRADPQFAAVAAAALAPEAPATPSTSTTSPAIDEKSVAVLAFANLSDDKSNEYFSDGISEELLTVLQKIPGLKVSARTSSFSFKGREATAQEIGAKLGVANLVEGSVRRAGNQVRITARLSRAATGEQVWSESYTRDLKDIFAVQTELAQTILAQLQSRLGATVGRAEIAAQVAAATKGGTRNAEAHELYLQGKYFLGRASMADCTRATDLLQRAVELDPGFALGWAALSSAGWFRGGYGATRQDYEEGYALAKRAADRAIELEPAMAAGWIARFDLQSSTEFDWRGSRESLRRAQALAPDDPEVLFRAAALTYTFGDMPRALELTRQVKSLDPVNTQIYIQEAYTLLALRRPAEAREAFQHVLDLSANAAWGHAGVGLALVAAGNYAAADEEAGRSTLDWSRLYVQTMARFGLKQRAESDRALAELASRLGDVAAYQVACAHAFRGEADQAFEWLDRAYRQHDPGLSWSKQDFFLQSLHADPRWDAFMHKLGLADDQLK